MPPLSTTPPPKSIKNYISYKRDGARSIKPGDLLNSTEGRKEYERLKKSFGWGEIQIKITPSEVL